ncbi:MAG: tetratricopeptide repeat protein [Pseudomonadales bacterium]|nr:tetratricopeptide repeat protein [Pseudomonadales bacterium]
MNTKLYKKVQTLAADLIDAAEQENDSAFEKFYAELKLLCEENEADEHKNHPVQWETLADFTEDFDDALVIYEKALELSHVRKTRDYSASIQYAMALLLKDMDKKTEALERITLAQASANKIDDPELQREIIQLLKSLS